MNRREISTYQVVAEAIACARVRGTRSPRAFALIAVSSMVVGCGSADPSPSDSNCASEECNQTKADSGASHRDAGAAETGRPTTSDAATREASIPEATACTPNASVDEPDDDFADTNCDGIDGDKSRAIFVAPTGSDGASGTLNAPVKTLTHAIELAVASQKEVFICNGTYVEAINLSTTGVSLFGGYECTAGWRRTTDRAVVAPTAGRPLTIEAVTISLQIDRLSFIAPDATQNGDSSIAAWVVDSRGIKFTNDRFESGAGGEGKPGAPATASTAPPPKGEDGVSVLAACPQPGPGCQAGNGGRASAGTCSNGGPGGAGGDVRRSPALWQPSGGQAGTPNGATGGSPGFAGNPGAPGALGAEGSPTTASFGTLSIAGYLPNNAGTDGAPGASGRPGGGGSGGDTTWNGGNYDSAFLGAGGGQGGHGGCGGVGGKGGGGGGASIALVLLRSTATLSWCAIKTGSGGMGGMPSAGAAGQVGGQPGAGGVGAVPQCNGFPGGAGGRGGPGGAGGPGGGGPSIGIVATGGTPEVNAITFETGSGGVGGRGVSAEGPAGFSGATLFLDTDAGAPP